MKFSRYTATRFSQTPKHRILKRVFFSFLFINRSLTICFFSQILGYQRYTLTNVGDDASRFSAGMSSDALISR